MIAAGLCTACATSVGNSLDRRSAERRTVIRWRAHIGGPVSQAHSVDEGRQWHSELHATNPLGTSLHFSALPTSMIGLCQEAKSPPEALGRSAGVNSFLQRVVLASRPRFLFENRTRLPLASAALPLPGHRRDRANRWDAHKPLHTSQQQRILFERAHQGTLRFTQPFYRFAA